MTPVSNSEQVVWCGVNLTVLSWLLVREQGAIHKKTLTQ
jgi:hypothetical protein